MKQFILSFFVLLCMSGIGQSFSESWTKFSSEFYASKDFRFRLTYSIYVDTVKSELLESYSASVSKVNENFCFIGSDGVKILQSSNIKLVVDSSIGVLFLSEKNQSQNFIDFNSLFRLNDSLLKGITPVNLGNKTYLAVGRSDDFFVRAYFSFNKKGNALEEIRFFCNPSRFNEANISASGLIALSIKVSNVIRNSGISKIPVISDYIDIKGRNVSLKPNFDSYKIALSD